MEKVKGRIVSFVGATAPFAFTSRLGDRHKSCCPLLFFAVGKMPGFIKKILTGNHDCGIKIPKKILIIESREQMRSEMERALSRHYQVLAAFDKAGGLDMAIHDRPDLILLNGDLAGEKTVDLCAQLKREEPTKHIPLVVIMENNADVIEYYLQRIDGNLLRPFSGKELLRRVKFLIG